MRIHVDTLFALGGRIYRPGPADAPDDVAKWAIGRGYARALDAAPGGHKCPNARATWCAGKA